MFPDKIGLPSDWIRRIEGSAGINVPGCPGVKPLGMVLLQPHNLIIGALELRLHDIEERMAAAKGGASRGARGSHALKAQPNDEQRRALIKRTLITYREAERFGWRLKVTAYPPVDEASPDAHKEKAGLAGCDILTELIKGLLDHSGGPRSALGDAGELALQEIQACLPNLPLPRKAIKRYGRRELMLAISQGGQLFRIPETKAPGKGKKDTSRNASAKKAPKRKEPVDKPTDENAPPKRKPPKKKPAKKKPEKKRSDEAPAAKASVKKSSARKPPRKKTSTDKGVAKDRPSAEEKPRRRPKKSRDKHHDR